jgi:hypothetical protein
MFYAYLLHGTYNSQRIDYKGDIVVIEKTDKNFYTTGEDYEEWLTISKEFNTGIYMLINTTLINIY